MVSNPKAHGPDDAFIVGSLEEDTWGGDDSFYFDKIILATGRHRAGGNDHHCSTRRHCRDAPARRHDSQHKSIFRRSHQLLAPMGHHVEQRIRAGRQAPDRGGSGQERICHRRQGAGTGPPLYGAYRSIAGNNRPDQGFQIDSPKRGDCGGTDEITNANQMDDISLD